MKDIAVIQTNGYWGVYLDGKLMIEDDEAITVQDITALLDESDDGGVVKLSFVDMSDDTDFDKQVYEDGGFPEEWPL